MLVASFFDAPGPQITVDGTIDNCFTEDVPLRFQAAGWNVIDAGRPENEEDAAREISTIADALQQAREHTGAPTLVLVRTTIGFGSRKQDTGPAHGQALGDEEVAYVKEKFRLNPEERFVVPESVRRSYAKVIPRGAALEQEWNDLYSRYAAAYPTEANELSRRVAGELPPNWQSLLPTRDQLPTAPQPTRKSSGIVVEALASKFPDFVAGSADLLESTFVSWKGMTEFQKVSHRDVSSTSNITLTSILFGRTAQLWSRRLRWSANPLRHPRALDGGDRERPRGVPSAVGRWDHRLHPHHLHLLHVHPLRCTGPSNGSPPEAPHHHRCDA